MSIRTKHFKKNADEQIEQRKSIDVWNFLTNDEICKEYENNNNLR